MTKWNYYLQGCDIVVHNGHKAVQKFLNCKNANNKVNRWSLELSIYNINFEWISGACKKAAHYLSGLVDVKDTPEIPTDLINILFTSTPDGPAIHIHSKMHNTANTKPADPTTASTGDMVNAPPSLTEDRKDTLRLMQGTDPFCKHISKRLQSGKAPSQKVDTFTHIKGLIYKHLMDSNQRFLALVIPKSWHFTVLSEAHDNLGHQGVNRTYHLIKCQYYWKGMNKDIYKYINNCALCKREKARTHKSLSDD